MASPFTPATIPAALPSWWTVVSTPGSEAVTFDGDVTIEAAAFPAAAEESLVIARTGEVFRALVIDSDGNALVTGQGGASGKLLVRQQGAPVAGYVVRAANDGSSDARLYNSSGNVVHELSVVAAGTGTMGLFGATPAAQPAAIANASGGAIIDAEARAALNSLLAACRTLGLIAT